MTIPEEAIEAAARTKHENSRQGGLSRWENETDSYRTYLMDEARDELEAAMPAIEKDMRERITQEIEARRFDYPYTRGSSVRNKAWSSGIAAAARIVRGGTR